MERSGTAKRTICGRYAVRTEGPRCTQPVSGVSSFMTSFRNVVLPAPLSPMRAMRSPPVTVRSRS